MNIQNMGVINITPNSFSDGGESNNFKTFSLKFQNLLEWADIIDIGAESTAPFNSSIDNIVELERFEQTLFPFIYENEDPRITLSIDTYKPEIFYEVFLMIQKYWPKTKVIFNDISGCVDDELIDLLSMGLDFDYVLCHNLTPLRYLSSNHMDYAEHSVDIVQNMIDFFKLNLSLLEPLPTKIIIDPCFGFSKTRTQNHRVLAALNNIIDIFENDFLFGVSKKSFLRFPADLDPKENENSRVLESMQSILIHELISFKHESNLIFRLHDDISLKSALNIRSILE